MPDSPRPLPNETFDSAGPLKINFTTVLSNFATYGKVPASKINMGFEPGEQSGAGVWEGEALDEAVATAIKNKQTGDHTGGGVAEWAINPKFCASSESLRAGT